jgi:SAM-dependent methyltransferase
MDARLDLSDDAAITRGMWNEDAPNWVASGRAHWARTAPHWGTWDVPFPLIHASAEATPLADGSFDLAFSEFGAAIWCNPYVWIPEAHRLLREGGRLIFLCNSVLAILCSPDSEEPAGETLMRAQFGLHRILWPGTEGPDFHLPHGDMIALLRRTGFEVEALHELRAPGSGRAGGSERLGAGPDGC